MGDRNESFLNLYRCLTRTGNLCIGNPRRTPPKICTRDTCMKWPVGKRTTPCPVWLSRRSSSTQTQSAPVHRVCTPDDANVCTGIASRIPEKNMRNDIKNEKNPSTRDFCQKYYFIVLNFFFFLSVFGILKYVILL